MIQTSINTEKLKWTESIKPICGQRSQQRKIGIHSQWPIQRTISQIFMLGNKEMTRTINLDVLMIKSPNRPMCDDPKCQSTMRTVCSDKNCQETNAKSMKSIPKEYRRLCQDQTCQSTRCYKMISDPQKRQKIHHYGSSKPRRYKSGCDQ